MVTTTTDPPTVESGRVPWLLQRLDRIFPANPQAFMTGDQQTVHEIAKASDSMGGYLRELGDERMPSLDVLDFGCGWGGETLWLASRVRSVCGVDVDRKAVDQANAAVRAANAVNCRCEWSADGRLPFADGSFDAVLSTNVFEHVMDLDLAFHEIERVLKPGGSLLTRFGPLFYSPHGYHLYWACQVPYAHLLFGLDAIGTIRAVRGGSRVRPKSWRDLGLNGKRFDDYRRSVDAAGLEVVRFRPLAVKGLNTAASLPLVKDWFIFGIDCHVRRRIGNGARGQA
jgi:SAM-dependent methyltransferase